MLQFRSFCALFIRFCAATLVIIFLHVKHSICHQPQQNAPAPIFTLSFMQFVFTRASSRNKQRRNVDAQALGLRCKLQCVHANLQQTTTCWWRWVKKLCGILARMLVCVRAQACVCYRERSAPLPPPCFTCTSMFGLWRRANRMNAAKAGCVGVTCAFAWEWECTG